MACKAANGTFLDRNQDFVFSRQAIDQIRIERLAETRIGNRRRQSLGGKIVGRTSGEVAPADLTKMVEALKAGQPIPGVAPGASSAAK